MAKQQIQLTEQDLHFLVEDAVKVYLRENGMEEGVWSGMKNMARGIGNGNFHMMQNYRSGSYAGSIQKYGQNAQKALSQFKNILDKSGAQQIGQQVQTISQELGKIMSNYQQIATQASNKQSVQQSANNAQADGQVQGTAPNVNQNSNPYPVGNSMGNAARQAAVNQKTTKVGAPASMNSRSSEDFNSQYSNMGNMKFGESRNMKITQSDLRKLVSETVNILLAEDGEIGGAGATNCVGINVGGAAGQAKNHIDALAFGGKSKKKVGGNAFSEPIMRQAHNLGDVTSAPTNQVDMKPALARGGSISMNRKK